jgi:hypothetical protein
MAQQLSKTGITTTQTVEAWHVTQSVDALTAANAYDINISGSLDLTGPLTVTGDVTATGRVYLNNIGIAITPQILGYVPANGRLYYFNTSSLSAQSASYALFAVTASYAPNIYNTNGTLTDNRVLSLNGSTLEIAAADGDVNIISNPSYTVSITGLPTTTQPSLLFWNPANGQITRNTTSSFTSSWASRAVSSSFATTASYALTSSFATTASFVVTASYVNTAYLSAYSLDTQNIAVGATGQAITYDNIDFSQGISITGGSNIRVATAGKYNIQFSLQLDEGASSITDAWIWLKKNSTDIPASNTQYSWRSRGVAAWNFFVDALPSDLFQIYIATSTNNVSLVTDTAPFAGPVIPSVILTVNKIG